MNKSKFSIRPIAEYLRELSIVVTGIVITIGTGFWIAENNNKKDQKQYLLAVKLELEENAESFDLYAKWLQKSVGYADYLRSNDKKSLNKDTLAYYLFSDNDGCGYACIIPYTTMLTTNAFEMLKYSGVMRKIKDKELLLSIWGAYVRVEGTKLNIDRCFRMKEEESMKEKQLSTEGKPIAVPMQVF